MALIITKSMLLMIIHMQSCKKPSYYSCQTSSKWLRTTWKPADENHPPEHTAERQALWIVNEVAVPCDTILFYTEVIGSSRSGWTLMWLLAFHVWRFSAAVATFKWKYMASKLKILACLYCLYAIFKGTVLFVLDSINNEGNFAECFAISGIQVCWERSYTSEHKRLMAEAATMFVLLLFI